MSPPICVKDVMSTKVRTVPPVATIRQAARTMTKAGIGSLVILDGSRPVGMVTEGDISRAVARGRSPSAPVPRQRKKLVTVEPGVRLEVAARLMATAGVKKLPVMEGGRLVGMITQTDIVNSSFALVTSLKEMVRARYRPPDFEM
jgi:CBS domain-containing protein